MDGLLHYHKEERPWGSFERFTLNEPSTVKIITLKPDQATSLQLHQHRDEFWQVIHGSGIITIGDTEHTVAPGASLYGPRTLAHRLAAGPQGLTLLEIAFGEFNEEDITRLDDKYGRV